MKHDYLGIKPDRVWEIIDVDLRSLRTKLRQAIDEER